jgi:hypothetical protein
MKSPSGYHRSTRYWYRKVSKVYFVGVLRDLKSVFDCFLVVVDVAVADEQEELEDGDFVLAARIVACDCESSGKMVYSNHYA